jgi:esterase
VGSAVNLALLNYREMGSGPALICLHGLYGYGRNWFSLARQLQEQYRVILPDLRNHGASFHSEQWDYTVMVQDLQHLVESLNLDSFALLGHSMGGKVAMSYAQSGLALGLSHLIIADIAPKKYPSDYHRGILQLLSDLPLQQIQTREEAELFLKQGIPELAVRRFLVSNLKRVDSIWQWQFNLPVLMQQIDAVMAEVNFRSSFQTCPVLFLSGGSSNYVLPDDHADIKRYFPGAKFTVIPDAGHWLHIEKAQSFLETLCAFLGS